MTRAPAFPCLAVIGFLLTIPSGAASQPGSPPAAPPEDEVPSLTLGEVLRITLAENPELGAERLGRAAARATVGVARQRPNPDLSLEAAKDTPHETAILSLPIETGAKRHRRIQLAEAQARTGEAGLERSAMEIRDRARRAFYAVAASQLRAEQRTEERRLAERIRDAAQARFEAGDSPRLEVVQTDLGVSLAEGEAASAEGELIAARAELNTLLARPAGSPLKAAGDLLEGSVPPAETAVPLALASSSGLGVLARQVEEQALRAAVARANRFADPVVQGGVSYWSPPDFTYGWLAGISWTLPLARHRAEIEVEEGALVQAEARREAARLRIEGEVERCVALAESARQRTLRFRDQILPRIEEVEGMAEDSYRSGQAGLVVLLQALAPAREARRQAIDAGIEYQNALADLERAVGAPLP